MKTTPTIRAICEALILEGRKTDLEILNEVYRHRPGAMTTRQSLIKYRSGLRKKGHTVAPVK